MAVLGRRWWAGPSTFDAMGRARPGPSTYIWWAAAQPGPSNFQRMGRGPARPIRISEDGPRPGPTHHIGSEAHEVRAL